MSDKKPTLRDAAWAFLSAWYFDSNPADSETCDAAVDLLVAVLPHASGSEICDIIVELGEGIAGPLPPETQP